ncbi:hypothetical protein BUE80_DR009552 [Diplocarpon rosae]|nr:hypothetical protein BUE80_DR009552 [Diplocarpon rosae]
MLSKQVLLVLAFSAVGLAVSSSIAVTAPAPERTIKPLGCSTPFEYPPIPKDGKPDCLHPLWPSELDRKCRDEGWDKSSGPGQALDAAGNVLYCETTCCFSQ